LCVANGLHVPPIAYKLRSLSDLPGLILQVAGTPTHGVLVSVIVYTRILVSDHIGVCPYRPFSSFCNGYCSIRQDYHIGTARKMSVDTNAVTDLLLLIQQKLRIMQYRYGSLSFHSYHWIILRIIE